MLEGLHPGHKGVLRIVSEGFEFFEGCWEGMQTKSVLSLGKHPASGLHLRS